MPGEAVETESENSQLPSYQTSDFLLELKEKNSLIAFQALLDSIDLWVSCIKYYCDILNPASSRLSAQMMVDILSSPEGATIFFIGAALFGAFAFIGNYSDAEDKKNSVIANLCDTYWPYVRDSIKGVKWTYKGMRSVFLVGQMVTAQLSIAYIVPLGVTFGAISAVNRFWNRGMVERRKQHQIVNDSFRAHIKSINACFISLESEPSQWELQNIYQGCIIKLPKIVENADDKAGKEGTSEPQFDYYRVVKNAVALNESKQQYWGLEPINNLSENEKSILDCNHKREDGDRIDWFHFRTILKEKGIPENSVLGTILEEKKQFLQKISYQKKLIDDGTQSYSRDMLAGFVHLNNWPSDKVLMHAYQHCVVHLDGQDEQAGYYHIYVDDTNGTVVKEKLPQEDSECLNHIKHLSAVPIDEYVLALQSLPNSERLKNFALERKKIIERNYQYYQLIGRPEFQKDSLEAKCSAILGGVLNAPYYFLGLLSMVSLPYTAFIGAVAACSAFMLLNVVAEYYQESDYQRRLKISQLKANMSMLKRLISSEWDLINDLLPSSNNRDAEQKKAKEKFELYLKTMLACEMSEEDRQLLMNYLKLENEDENDQEQPISTALNDEQQAMLQYLRNVSDYQKRFEQDKKALRAELVLSDNFILMQGIRNGLYCYGIANGFLMTLAIMSFFGVFSFTPAMFWASIGFGFFCVAAGLLYTWWNAKAFSEAHPTEKNRLAAELQNQRNPMITEEDSRTWGNEYYFDAKSRGQIETVDDIKQTQNLMISDQCEVLRQVISGNKKGYKLLQTLSVFLPALAANSQATATQAIYLSVGLFYAGFFALKGLRNLVRVDNKEYEKSTTWKMLTFWDTPKKADSFATKRQSSVNTIFSRDASSSPVECDANSSSPRRAFSPNYYDD